MVINWYGEGCFKIQAGQLTILTDPFSAQGGSASGGDSIGKGLTPPRFKADLVIKTLSLYPLPYERTETAIIYGPGEYEIKGAEISGWPIKRQSANREAHKELKSIYLVKLEDMNLGFLGYLDEMPDAEIIEELNQPDLLFIPAGGKPYIDEGQAAKLIKQLNPKMVIASFFKIPGLKTKVGDHKEFLQELGQKAEPEEKLTVKKKELPQKTKVVVLKV